MDNENSWIYCNLFSQPLEIIRSEIQPEEFDKLQLAAQEILKQRATDLTTLGQQNPDSKTIKLTKKFVQLFPDKKESINKIDVLKKAIDYRPSYFTLSKTSGMEDEFDPLYDYYQDASSIPYQMSIKSKNQSEEAPSLSMTTRSEAPKFFNKPWQARQLDDRFIQLQHCLSQEGESLTLAYLEKLFPEINTPKTTNLTIPDIVRTIMIYIKDHPQIFEQNPSEGTRIHHLISELARKEMLKGNIANAFEINAQIAEILPLSNTHPLFNLDEAISSKSATLNNPSYGANFSQLDTSIVKGGHVHAAQKIIDKELVNCFDFKISHFAREELTPYIKAILENPEVFIESLKPYGINTLINTNALQSYLIAENGKFSNSATYNPSYSMVTEIIFEGVAKIKIGNDPLYGCLFNQIQVEFQSGLPPGEGLQKLQLLFSALGLGPVLSPQPPDADERMKIAQLTRAFFPMLATSMDTQREFYQLSLEELKQKIISKEPQMAAVFQKYLVDHPELMQKEDILPGKAIWSISDLGNQIKAAGAWGLMMGVGASGPFEQRWKWAKQSIAGILSDGLMSSEQRLLAGSIIGGVSSAADLRTGGGDQVFARMVTKNVSHEINKYAFFGEAQVLLDITTLAGRVPYAYYSDHFGVKNRYTKNEEIISSAYVDIVDYDVYANRSNLIDFAQNVTGTSNEVMLKNSVSTPHIRGIVVATEEKREELISYLLEKGIAKKGEENIVYIGSHKANQFIHVSTEFKEEMWNKN